jgi:Protein of unknown function (DUF3046)
MDPGMGITLDVHVFDMPALSFGVSRRSMTGRSSANGGTEGPPDRSVRVVSVRLTEFRGLMEAQFGPLRAPSVARDHVFGALQGRTADEALAEGEDPRNVWFAVCDDFDVSDSLRYGLPD